MDYNICWKNTMTDMESTKTLVEGAEARPLITYSGVKSCIRYVFPWILDKMLSYLINKSIFLEVMFNIEMVWDCCYHQKSISLIFLVHYSLMR